jgi:hypothetical protein
MVNILCGEIAQVSSGSKQVIANVLPAGDIAVGAVHMHTTQR